MNTLLKKIQKNSERGQAIILIAFSIVGLVAIVGLMIDGGILLIEYARLKRAIDSASIAAASQFRKEYVVADLENAGTEFLNFNQTKPDDVTVFTCETDESLCAAATGGVARKLVRVTASRRVDFGFIRVIGINSTTISATSIGEAASIDMVLVIDTSSSMAYDTTDYTPGDGKDNDPAISASQPGDDPAVCNSHLPGVKNDGVRCEPLGTIMDVAVDFVETNLLFYPYDRVAIVASTEQSVGGQRNPQLMLPFSDNQDDDGDANEEIQEAIRALRVFQPAVCGGPEALVSLGGCVRRAENLPNGAYETIGCDRNDATLGPSTCGSSNIGGSLYMAGRQFDFARQESFWAVVALIGGPATATNPIEGKPEGFCPPDTWPPPNGPGNGRGCRDFDTPSVSGGFSPLTFDWEDDVTRHPTGGILDPDYGFDPENPVYPANYDPDDYARDAADFVTSRSIGQGATLYSICLGNLCQVSANTTADPHSGDHLGRYMAEYSGGTNANHGVYYLAPDADQLDDIFLQIGNNIFTRISQ